MKKMISLKNAMVVWNAPRDRKKPIGILVVEYPESENCESKNYTCSWGTCYSNWIELTGKERMQCLLQEGWRLALDEHFSVKEIHKAFLHIKEYSDCWAGFGE
jgi:hypothetical protein